MIGSLQGIVALRDDPHLLIETSGVGYKVLASVAVLSKAVPGQEIKIFTYTHVREDALELFGFLAYEDLKLFERLISVSGIGPKTALGIFTIGSRSEIISAILKADTAFFQGVPRLGKKNAQKLIIELKNKFGDTGSDLDLQAESGSDEVMQALASFGFSTREAYDAIKATSGQGTSTQEKVKLALKYLGK